ncbi:MAG: GNAT family N-acetyltransferase [Pirellulaceae bacterium]
MGIETLHVILRRPEPTDVERIWGYRNDPAVMRHLGGFSPPMSMKDVVEWIERHRNRTDEIIWVIADRENSACLGHVGLYQLDYRLQVAEFAICIGDKSWWGKGLGKEVTAAVVAYGFNELHLKQIRLSVLESNQRAVGLYEKLGFQHDGRLRQNQFRDGQYVDSLLMSLLKGEWKTTVK